MMAQSSDPAIRKDVGLRSVPGSERATPTKCLTCHSAMTLPIVCTGCHTLYPPAAALDYFDLLGLPRSFALDDARVQAAYRAATRQIHPDRFAGQPDEARQLATRLTAIINEAARVLGDPVLRAEYLLEQAGGPAASEVRDVPGSLLMEVLSIREEIEEARQTGDADAIARVRESVLSRRRAALTAIAEQADGLSAATAEQRTAFRKSLNAMKYYDNLLAESSDNPLQR